MRPDEILLAVNEWVKLEAEAHELPVGFHDWSVKRQPCSLQFNYTDCGVFMLIHMLYTALGALKMPRHEHLFVMAGRQGFAQLTPDIR